MYLVYYVVGGICFINEIRSQGIGDEIADYFKSDTVKNFEKLWFTEKKAIENAIELSIQETVGRGQLNILSKPSFGGSGHQISKGYYHEDKHLKLFFSNLTLQSMPQLWLPTVKLSLASNRIDMESRISNFIVNADYMAVRNKTELVYAKVDQNSGKTSAFLYNHVPNSGNVAVVAEGCHLSGQMITRLSGESINIGHHHLSLDGCQYTVEIHTPGSGVPPVIMPYLRKNLDRGMNMEHLLLEPLKQDLVPKLQKALHSFVNMSALLGKHLTSIRNDQDEIFKKVKLFTTQVTRDINKFTSKSNSIALPIDELHLYWDDIPHNIVLAAKRIHLTLSDLALAGLETIYSSHTGGPFKSEQGHSRYGISEQLTFNTLQVRGTLAYEGQSESKYPFTVEMHDVDVNLQLVAKPKGSESPVTLRQAEVTGIRDMAISITGSPLLPSDSLIIAYVQQQMSKQLSQYVIKAFKSTGLASLDLIKLQGDCIVTCQNGTCSNICNKVAETTETKTKTETKTIVTEEVIEKKTG